MIFRVTLLVDVPDSEQRFLALQHYTYSAVTDFRSCPLRHSHLLRTVYKPNSTSSRWMPATHVVPVTTDTQVWTVNKNGKQSAYFRLSSLELHLFLYLNL